MRLNRGRLSEVPVGRMDGLTEWDDARIGRIPEAHPCTSVRFRHIAVCGQAHCALCPYTRCRSLSELWKVAFSICTEGFVAFEKWL